MFFLLAIALFASCNSGREGNSSAMDVRLDSAVLLMKQVNAGYLICIDSNGNSSERHWGRNIDGQTISDTSMFEAASLSKTVTAFIFWSMLQDYPELNGSLNLLLKCDGTNAENLDIRRLLRHSVRSIDSCVIETSSDTFSYSEDNYLLLQKIMEKVSGLNLEALAVKYVFAPLKMKHSSFVWQETFTDCVNGFYEDNKLHREIRRFDVPKSNGTLYSCARDFITFSKALMNSSVLDSISKNEVQVHKFRNIRWGNGMGMDYSTGDRIFWQWGSNWSYNHILLIDEKSNICFIGLTNSMIGAKRLRETGNFLFRDELELFNYINWY